MSEPLQEAFFETERARLQRWLPWVHLFRAFRLATRWQNLALALLAVLCLAAGRWGLSYLPFSSYARGDGVVMDETVIPFGGLTVVDRRTVWPWEQEFLSPPLPTVRDAAGTLRLTDPATLVVPLLDFVRPAAALFERRAAWSHVADNWLNTLLVLLIGSIFGGAITRRVALEFGVSREPGLRNALRFGVTELPYTFGAPLLSVVGVGMLLLFGRVIAWIGRLPQVGETAAAVLWGLLLVFSLVMALILIGVAAAWPLMVAAHSCEGSDSFDALNRAYNYVFVRPWYAAWLVLVTLGYGTLLMGFVLSLTGLTLHLSEWMAAGPLSDEALARITVEAPDLVKTSASPAFEEPTTPGGRIGGVWQRGLAAGLTAFVYSFFWTAATLIYLLLRRSVDACELTKIYEPKPAPPPGPPLVGMAAVERREQAAATPPADLPQLSIVRVRELISAAAIQNSVAELGGTISRDYADRPLTVLGVLTGSIMLVTDLMRRIDQPHQLGLLQASSYRGPATYPGELRINADFLPDVRGRDVLLVDDIFDTGRTLASVVQRVQALGPASVRTAVLLWKRPRTQVDLRPDYVCFEIPDEFVVGYGLDYNGEYRHLPYIGVLEA
jgi:hypoxanthine phosphoribosyltransferase